jgi:hypothetical protein
VAGARGGAFLAGGRYCRHGIEGRPPLIKWRDDDYAALDGDVVIGLIYKEHIPAGAKWCWFLHIACTSPNSGSADSLDEAEAALTVSYERRRGQA